MKNSEIAQIRQNIQSEYEAAEQGLSGLASGSARHDFISKRTENIERHHKHLINLVGPEQAIAIIADTIWTPTDQGTVAS